MQCEECKYFAVPLNDEEKRLAHCPGANPEGDASKKICTLRNRQGFEDHDWNPGNCVYFFSKFLRFR